MSHHWSHPRVSRELELTKELNNDMYEITLKSMQLLDPPNHPNQNENWLNDEIINGYVELIKQRYQKEEGHKYNLEFFNTYAYSKLVQLMKVGKIHQFDRILKRKKITELGKYDKIFIPVNLEKSHWLLLVVNISYNWFEFYDSIK